MPPANSRSSFSATIANGASLSGAVDMVGLTLTAILMPAAWTAANLTFQASVDGSTYVNVYNDSGDEYVIPADTSRLIVLVGANFAGMRYLKVRSGTAGSAVNQGGARTVTLVCKR